MRKKNHIIVPDKLKFMNLREENEQNLGISKILKQNWKYYKSTIKEQFYTFLKGVAYK